MRTTLHGRNIVQVTRFPRVFPINAYLVREADGLTVVDTGMSGMDKGIVSAADDLGLPIVRILLTHAHGDHAGSLDALYAKFPDAEILVGGRESRLLAGDMKLDAGEPQTKLRGGYVTSEVRPTRLIAPGDRIGSLEAISAPGHTPGHLAFLDLRDRTLIAGDAFQTRGGVAVSGRMRYLFPFPAMATWHAPTALETARRLYDLAPKRLLVGHGDGIEQPLPAMERAIAEAAQSIDREVVHVA